MDAPGGAHAGTQPGKKVIAVRVLGLLPDSHRAIQLAQDALRDTNPEVRAAAATPLGKMRALSSVPRLKELLSDEQFSVAMAAANALHELSDPASTRCITQF